jgi:hypothetical protein
LTYFIEGTLASNIADVGQPLDGQILKMTTAQIDLEEGALFIFRILVKEYDSGKSYLLKSDSVNLSSDFYDIFCIEYKLCRCVL